MFTSTLRSQPLRGGLFRFRRPWLQTTILASARRNYGTAPPGYVEDNSKGAMLRFQDSLPRLPVPTLEETAKRYLKSVHPLMTESEYAKSKAVVEDFIKPGGVGSKLQEKLVARREDPAIKNWLADWWRQDSYLAFRDAVVPNVSYFYSYKDDPVRRNGVKRAAAITFAVLEFKKIVDSGSLEPDIKKGVPLCMDCYTLLFNSARIPARPADYTVKYPVGKYKHFIAIRKNQFFKVPFEINGKQLSKSELEQQFERIYSNAQDVPAVGALTSEHRDVWADARELLIKTGSKNEESLNTIDTASFIVCLDKAAPVTLEERAHQFWHGDGANRWYDKTLQFIVTDNGAAGFMGEHSMMDGTPTHALGVWINEAISGNKIDLSDSLVRTELPAPQVLQFEVTEPVQAEIDRAAKDFHEAIDAHDLTTFNYQGYGKGLIKKIKCSPDAFVQLVMQLAYFKMFSVCRPTYESAETRRFQLGRTEACRTVSDESVAWCNAMEDPSKNDNTRIELFRKAAGAHMEYLKAVADGKGVDRHLWGLKKLLEADEEVPEIYKDPAYSYSSSWYVSTSQISTEYYNTYGWSQDYEGGFGIAYTINENSMNFTVVSKKLGSDRLSYYLNLAAGEVRELMIPRDISRETKL